MSASWRRTFAIIGIVGVLIITVACIITALNFTGAQGERYSPLTHFISELGYVAVSQSAAIFNWGLIIGAPCLGIFLVGLGLSLKGWLRYPFVIISVISGIAGMLVGVFPMDNLDAHGQVAQAFFLTGGVVVAIFSLYILFSSQTRYPRWIVLIGIVSVVSFAAFLSIILPGGRDALAAPDGVRPSVWITVVWEWLILISVLLWIFVVALYFRKPGED